MHKLLLALSASLVLAACAVQEPQRPADPEDGRPGAPFTVTDDLPAGTFANNSGGYSGELFVRGYADETTVNEPFCEQNCKTFRYVFFHILETGSDSLQDFLPQNEGNAYVGPSSLGIGCINEDGVIHYFNHSDGYDMREFMLDADETNAILDSSVDTPITLRLSKEPLSGGSEAPACYSHFTEIAVSE